MCMKIPLEKKQYSFRLIVIVNNILQIGSEDVRPPTMRRTLRVAGGEALEEELHTELNRSWAMGIDRVQE